MWKERFRPTIDSSIPKAVHSVITLAWTQNAVNRPPMKEIEVFLAGLVFIDGLESENEVMDSDMSTQLLTIPATKAKEQVKKEEFLAPIAESARSEIIVSSGTKELQTKRPSHYRKRSRNKRIVICIVVAVTILLAGSITIVISISRSRKDSGDPIESNPPPFNTTSYTNVTGVDKSSLKATFSRSNTRFDGVASSSSSISNNFDGTATSSSSISSSFDGAASSLSTAFVDGFISSSSSWVASSLSTATAEDSASSFSSGSSSYGVAASLPISSSSASFYVTTLLTSTTGQQAISQISTTPTTTFVQSIRSATTSSLQSKTSS